MELDLGPLLLHRTQCGAMVHQQGRCVDRIEGDAVGIGIHEFLQFVRVVTGDPTREVELAAQDACFHAVFMLQPVRHHFKLQLADGTEQ